jgi:hypothetical protein
VQAPLDVPVSGAVATRVGFGNLRAVVTTMAVAAFGLFVLFFAMLIAPPLALVVICAAGYAAAYLYGRQSSQTLSPGNGAYLGLMTGLWLFLVFAVCAAVAGINETTAAGRDLLRAGMARVPEAAKLVDDPHQFLVTMLSSLVALFFLATVAAAFGGMLAARLSARRQHS